jgi:hypothetical protein
MVKTGSLLIHKCYKANSSMELMAKKIKSFLDKLKMTPMEKELSKAKDIYEVEAMIKRMSYVHNVKGWM